jgi:hypothetical protein
VRRVYEELLRRGEPVKECERAATVVFRWHHPELSAREAALSIAAWCRPAVIVSH